MCLVLATHLYGYNSLVYREKELNLFIFPDYCIQAIAPLNIKYHVSDVCFNEQVHVYLVPSRRSAVL